jgi:hypothetical protein
MRATAAVFEKLFMRGTVTLIGGAAAGPSFTLDHLSTL